MAKPKKTYRWAADAVLNNPILVQAGGLAAVIIAATTLQGALWISLVNALHLLICEVLAAAVLKRVPNWLRVAIYFVVGLALACPATYLLGAAISGGGVLTSLRIFMPLMAVNSLTAMRCERFAVQHSPSEAFNDAVSNALGFAAVALLTGGLREMLGYGSVWGVQLSKNLHIRGAWMPFGGFLILGALAALLKFLLRALSIRGVYAGADKALELAPQDRLERLEKSRRLTQAEPAEETPEEEPKEDAPQESEEPAAEEDAAPDEKEEAAPEEKQAAAPQPFTAPHMPVDAILQEYGLEGLDVPAEPDGPALTEEEKTRLVVELEQLLDGFEQKPEQP